jgi:hypothetical protein
VCLDPETGISDYHIPLELEVANAQAIVVARVVAVKRIHDDPSYPDYYSASIFTVRLLRTLKGDVPTLVRLRTENDSGRYEMALNDVHLLLLTGSRDYADVFIADSCGSSSLMPAGAATLKKIETLLGIPTHAS